MINEADSVDIGRGKWMALCAALLGWMFDGFEIGMFPLVGPKALEELLRAEAAANPAIINQWFGVIMSTFLIGAATGGVLFGWLGDRIGRVRAMSLSILTYAVFTGLCGFASEAWNIAVLRFIASLGMGGEWALGVSLVTELWPDRSRVVVAGLIGAAANVGFLLVGLLSLGLVGFLENVSALLRDIGASEEVVQALTRGEGWRLLMIAGALPALLVFFIRLFVPESHKWEAERATGSTSMWATRDLMGVLVGAIAAGGVVMLWSPVFDQWMRTSFGRGDEPFVIPAWAQVIRLAGTAAGLTIALLGFIYPVARYLARAEAAGRLRPEHRSRYIGRMLLGATLAGIALLGTWGSLQWAPKWAMALSKLLPADGGPYYAKEFTQIAYSLGAIVSAIGAALLAGWLGRRVSYFLLCLAALASCWYLFIFNDAYGPKFLASVFVAGGITSAFYGWFPLYLPELFPTSIRATSQGFAYNFGRVLSAVGSLQTATLTAYFARGIDADRIEVEAFPIAGATLASIYALGLVVIWFGPETKGQLLPE